MTPLLNNFFKSTSLIGYNFWLGYNFGYNSPLAPVAVNSVPIIFSDLLARSERVYGQLDYSNLWSNNVNRSLSYQNHPVDDVSDLWV